MFMSFHKLYWDIIKNQIRKAFYLFAKVLGKTSSPTIWMIVGQGPIALAAGAGAGCLDFFTLRYLFSSFSLSLGGGSI